MKEKAKFIGANGSRNLVNGRVYTVEVLSIPNSVKWIPDRDSKIHVFVEGSNWGIPYDTIHALIKNWDFTV